MARLLQWVKLGKAQNEHMFSEMPPIADMSEPCRHVRVVPISDRSPLQFKRHPR